MTSLSKQESSLGLWSELVQDYIYHYIAPCAAIANLQTTSLSDDLTSILNKKVIMSDINAEKNQVAQEVRNTVF